MPSPSLLVQKSVLELVTEQALTIPLLASALVLGFEQALIANQWPLLAMLPLEQEQGRLLVPILSSSVALLSFELGRLLVHVLALELELEQELEPVQARMKVKSLTNFQNLLSLLTLADYSMPLALEQKLILVMALESCSLTLMLVYCIHMLQELNTGNSFERLNYIPTVVLLQPL